LAQISFLFLHIRHASKVGQYYSELALSQEPLLPLGYYLVESAVSDIEEKGPVKGSSIVN